MYWTGPFGTLVPTALWKDSTFGVFLTKSWSGTRAKLRWRGLRSTALAELERGMHSNCLLQLLLQYLLHGRSFGVCQMVLAAHSRESTGLYR